MQCFKQDNVDADIGVEMSNTEENNVEKTSMKKNIMPFVLLTFLIIGASIFFLMHTSQFEETDNAYVETLPVQVSSKVSGQITKVYVNDNERVKKGDLVAEIDPVDYEVKLEEAGARYQSALLKQKNAVAILNAANSEIDLASRNLQRCKNLYKDGAISKQELDNAVTKYDEANARLTQAKEAVLSDSDNRVADAELKQLSAAKKQAALNLKYAKIYAPMDGFVTKKAIETGAYVQIGQPLFILVPQDVWIVANFKESQLENMEIGQEVEIKVDAYPKKIFKGKIDSIQRCSGAKASLFPPENAVGSFVKIVQRIPVKIVFTEPVDFNKYNIVTGMSVIPRVRVK